MRKSIIAIDIDDVLAANAVGFVEFSNRQWGTRLTPEDYDEHWMAVWGVDLDETLKRAQLIHDLAIMKDFAPDSSADKVLRKLSERFHLKIVTSRRVSISDITKEWIHRHYEGVFHDDDIHFAGIWDEAVDHNSIHRTKADIVQALDCDYLIDDQLKHCLAVAQRGSQALLFGEYTWNKSDTLPQNVRRVADWASVEAYFDGR